MPKIERPRRTIVASLAAVAVVALIVGVLYTMNSLQSTHAGSGGGHNNSSVVVATPTQTPAPTPYPSQVTPGPQANYVSKLYTTSDPPPPSNGAPANVTSHFAVGDTVYVSPFVHDLPKGEHMISIRWYLNGIFVESPTNANTSITINGGQQVIFSLKYQAPGIGMAKVYIDRPASDTSESPTDPSLAGTVIFVVEMARPTQQPGGPTPTPFVPTATPHP